MSMLPWCLLNAYKVPPVSLLVSQHGICKSCMDIGCVVINFARAVWQANMLIAYNTILVYLSELSPGEIIMPQ